MAETGFSAGVTSLFWYPLIAILCEKLAKSFFLEGIRCLYVKKLLSLWDNTRMFSSVINVSLSPSEAAMIFITVCN